MALLLPPSWDSGQSRWADGKRARVEERLSEFFATLEVRAVDDEERDQRRRREQEEREVRERLNRIEKARAERLNGEIAASNQADQIRAYISKVRARLGDVAPADRDRLIAWCDWPEARADSLDPASNFALIIEAGDERNGFGW